MKRIVITAGLVCAMALPGLASAQTATPGGQSGQGQAGSQGTTKTKPAGSGSQAPSSGAPPQGVARWLRRIAHSRCMRRKVGWPRWSSARSRLPRRRALT